MSDSKPQIDFKPKTQPILVGLPDYLKDPANYEKIQRALLDELASKHSHGQIEEWAACKDCLEKVQRHSAMMRALGFKSAAQYYAWKKIHEQIKKRYPLVDWKNNK